MELLSIVTASLMTIRPGMDQLSTPALIILGTSNGQILKCKLDNPSECEVFDKISKNVTNIVFHGDYLFVVDLDKRVFRCKWYENYSCKLYFHHQINTYYALSIFGEHIYFAAGTILWRCKMNDADSNNCYNTVQRFNQGFVSLFTLNAYIYFVHPQYILYCSKSKFKCSRQNFSTFFSDKNVAVFGNGTVISLGYKTLFKYIVLHTGTVNTRKYTTRTVDNGQRFVAAFNRKSYVLHESGLIKVADDSDGIHSFKVFANDTKATAISFAYGVYHMQEPLLYNCMGLRSPDLFIYAMEYRGLVEVSVANGLLVDASGTVVDTGGADRGYALLAMAPSGQLLLSGAHGSGLVSVASLLAGGPAAGAGEVVVERGVVKKITACSVHYLPDNELNRQVVEELFKQGLTGVDDIQLEECNYTCKIN